MAFWRSISSVETRHRSRAISTAVLLLAALGFLRYKECTDSTVEARLAADRSLCHIVQGNVAAAMVQSQRAYRLAPTDGWSAFALRVSSGPDQSVTPLPEIEAVTQFIRDGGALWDLEAKLVALGAERRLGAWSRVMSAQFQDVADCETWVGDTAQTAP
jgi:hypothetical protein